MLGLTVAQTVNADTYTVQNGDSFFGIASQYGVDPYQLAAENGMTIWSTIVPGGSLEVSGATTAVEETTEASSSEVTATDSDATWNRYPVGQCTWLYMLLVWRLLSMTPSYIIQTSRYWTA